MKIFITTALVILAGCATAPGTVDKTKMAEGYYMKGLSHLEHKNLEMAFVEFQRAIQTDKNNKWAYYGLGIISDMQGKFDDAVKYYTEALDIDSDFSEAHNALGVVYFKQQKWKDAIKSFRRALDNKLYTTPHVPYLNMGDLYMAQKDYEKAIASYRESKRFANHDIVILKLGTALFEAGRVKEAISEFQEGIGLAPKNAAMHYGLGLALLKDGNKKAAIAAFKKTIEISPGTELAQKAEEYIKTIR